MDYKGYKINEDTSLNTYFNQNNERVEISKNGYYIATFQTLEQAIEYINFKEGDK